MYRPLLRRSGTNAYSCYLALIAPVYIGWFLLQVKNLSAGKRCGHGILVGLLLINIVFTYSRALFIALGAVVLVAMLLSRYRWRIAAGLFFLLKVMILFVSPVQRTMFSFFDRRDTSNTDHLNSFYMALSQMAEHPINGWGGGHVKLKIQKQNGRWVNVYNTYKNPLDKLPGDNYLLIHQQALRDGVIIIHSPHNMYFTFMLNYGILGLLAFVGIFVMIFHKIRNIILHTSKDEYRILAWSSLYGTVGLMTYSWFQDSLTTTIMGLFFWVFLIFVAQLEKAAVAPYYLQRYRLLVLAYHRVLPESVGQTLAVTASAFQWQLELLQKRRFLFMTLAEYYTKHIVGSEPIQNDIAIITFDDGYADNYQYAFPILQKKHIPATFFITTACVGTAQPYYWDFKNTVRFSKDDYPMTWEQILDLQTAGMEIGSHTQHHYELARLVMPDLQDELAGSKKILERQLGKNIVSICYPRGQYTTAVFAAAAAVGYRVGVVTPRAKLPDSVFAVPRVGVYNHDSRLLFRLKISAPYRLLRAWRKQ